MSPEQRTENREEPPYPPMGGERDFFADIESAYPAKRTHNLKAARRVFAGVFGASPDPDRVAACVEAIGREAASTEWMRDGGRWVPKLSVWLAGWALQTHQPEAGAVLVDAARETVERLAANAGLSAPPSAQVMAGLAALRGQMGGRSW